MTWILLGWKQFINTQKSCFDWSQEYSIICCHQQILIEIRLDWCFWIWINTTQIENVLLAFEWIKSSEIRA